MRDLLRIQLIKLFSHSRTENSESTFQSVDDAFKNVSDSVSWVYHVSNELLFEICNFIFTQINP